ncbi:MAG: SDR family oxidoreductase [Victivallaceae bacterium]
MDILANKLILVTGGAGFIGSNLVETLLASGSRVVVLDNFSTGRRENLATFAGNKNFTLIEGDIRDYECCAKAVSQVDYVLHQAALGSVPRSIKDPMATTAVNVSGFVNMLFAAQAAGIKRFVYASSSSVYGDIDSLIKQEDKIGKPLSPYAISKCVDEMYAANFGKLYGIECIGLRYFNVFGPRQDATSSYSAVIPKFVSAMLKHQAPIINGDGSNSRDFTYVKNVVEANMLALTATNPAAVDKVYNVGCGSRTTLNELYKILQDILGCSDPEAGRLEPQYGPNRPGDVPHSLASIELARELLGYNPQYNVRQGLELATDWYIKQFENNML